MGYPVEEMGRYHGANSFPISLAEKQDVAGSSQINPFWLHTINQSQPVGGVCCER